MSDSELSYTLVAGVYLLGNKEYQYFARTKIKTKEVVRKQFHSKGGKVQWVVMHPDPHFVFRNWERPEVGLKEAETQGDYYSPNGKVLSEDMYREFKELFLRARVDKEILPSDFAKFRISKTMTISNVVNLLADLFKGQWDKNFVRMANLARCYVVSKDDIIRCKGEQLDGSEMVVLYVTGSLDGWLYKNRAVYYRDERSKVLALLYYFADYKLRTELEDKGDAWFVTYNKGVRAYDPSRVFAILDVYFGRISYTPYYKPFKR